MHNTIGQETARRNLGMVAAFAVSAGLSEIECRAIIAKAYRVPVPPETPAQTAVREVVSEPVAESLEAMRAEAPWPAACYKPSSCARHRMCVYALHPDQCRHVERDIGPEVDAATAAAARERAGIDSVAPGLHELARREASALFIITQDGTRLERNTGRPAVGSFEHGE